VLLWLSRHDGAYDESALSEAIGISAADCRDAVRYWMEAGVLVGPETMAVPPAPTATPSAPVIMPRPKAVKPQMPQVIARREESTEFSYLLDAVSARLGRPLSPGDMETLLYLFDTAGLPAEVVLMAVGYAASAERCSMRYIEKIALDWADEGIVTMAQAEEHLCQLERQQSALIHLTEVCGLDKQPRGVVARDAAVKWIYEWKMSDDVLRLAYDVCYKKTGKFEARYIDRVLENWHEQGVTTAGEVGKAGGKKHSAKPSEPSEYEKMVEQYVPVYKKKG
jgi:DnaD/phage-associated family protein